MIPKFTIRLSAAEAAFKKQFSDGLLVFGPRTNFEFRSAACDVPPRLHAGCRYSLMWFFLTLGASLIREEGGQVIDSKPVMFGRHGLEWNLLATSLERTLYPKAFQLLASIWRGGLAPRVRKNLNKDKRHPLWGLDLDPSPTK